MGSETGRAGLSALTLFVALAASSCLAEPIANPPAGQSDGYAIQATAPSTAMLSIPVRPTEVQDEPTATESSQWSFKSSVYLWLAGKRGVIETSNIAIPLDDPDESTGIFLYLEGERGRWGFVADVDLLSSEDETDIVTGTVEVDEDTLIGELDATYRLDDESSLQFLAGLRVLDSSQEIRFPIQPKESSDVTQTDLIVGAQGLWPLSDRFGFRLRGDIGGFGLDSDLTYQMFGVFTWEFAQHWLLTTGYRMVGWEFEANDVRNDLRLSGVLFGLAASF